VDSDKDPLKLPAWAQKQLADLRDENAKRRIEARTAVVNQHAQLAAQQLGANPHALLGSTAFAALAAGLNPHDAEFPAALTAAINQVVAANPWMTATSAASPATAVPVPAPPTSGAEFAAGQQAGQPITEAQLATMTPAQIQQAYSEGRLKHLM